MLEGRAVCAERRTYGSGRRSREIADDYALLLTLLRTAGGWLYLAVVLDLFTRQVIGWSMQPQLGREVVLQAVLMAVWQRPTSEAVILHSDRGTQYPAHEVQAFLKTHGIVSSMSGVGNCYDNAVAESFFVLLKRERVHRRHYRTRAEARTDIFHYIERFYNRQRRHSYSKGLRRGYMLNRFLKLLTNLSTKPGEDQLAGKCP